MKINDIIQEGENSTVEFKTTDVRPESLAKEMVAFAKHLGGRVLLGVDDNGNILGVEKRDIEEWVMNVARNNVVHGIQPVVHKHRNEGLEIWFITIN